MAIWLRRKLVMGRLQRLGPVTNTIRSTTINWMAAVVIASISVRICCAVVVSIVTYVSYTRKAVATRGVYGDACMIADLVWSNF